MTTIRPSSLRQDETLPPPPNTAVGGTAGNEFRSYREYLSYLAARNPKFSWPNYQFEYPHPRHQRSCETTVIDVVDGELRNHDKVNLDCLQCRSASVQTRIVLFSYSGVYCIDYDALDDICFAFRLDPYFISLVVDDEYGYFRDIRDYGRVSIDVPIDTPNALVRDMFAANKCFQLSYDQLEQYKLSVILTNGQGSGSPDTIILFCYEDRSSEFVPANLGVGYSNICCGPDAQPSAKAQRLSALALTELRTWPQKRVHAATKSPFEFALPYARILLNQAMEGHERRRLKSTWGMGHTFDGTEKEYLDNVEGRHFEAWILGERLSTSLESFQDFVESNGIPCSSSVQQITSAFGILISRTNQLKDALKDHLSCRASILSLEESRKSIQLADSVRSLTQLAFIFVPLTFGASIFGANLQDFGSGIVPTWKFAITLVAITLSTACFSLIWSARNGFLGELCRDTFETLHALFLFGLRSPCRAVLLSLHILFHLHNEPLRPVRQLRIDSLTSSPATGLPWRFKPAPDGTPLYEAFWMNCLYKIGQYTSQMEWYDDRFYKPWIRKRRQARGKAENKRRANDV